MPSRKRRRAASADANAATHGAVAASFERYPLLPLELREFIIKIACLSPRLPTCPHPPSPFGVDSGTTFSLSLVCRQINTQVTPLLWKSISITRPSSLYALREALLSRPDRRKLIVSLHIGPQDVLPSYWWPLSTVDHRPQERVNDDFIERLDAPTRHEWIASSLNREALPSGCVDRQAWCYERRPAGCRGSAIYEAIKEAERSLDVVLLDTSSEHPLHIERVILVQAALDLFLQEVRRIEGQDPTLLGLAESGARVPLACRNGKCRHYPSLRLSQLPSQTGAVTPAGQAPQHPVPDDAFVLSYPELLWHLGRPGALADRFDHPLYMERSGLKVNVIAPSTNGPKTYYPSSARYSLGADNSFYIEEHPVHRWPGHESLLEAARRSTTSNAASNAYSAITCSATLHSILRLVRDVVDLAKEVRNLSLTGFLESGITGASARALPSLRRLSIGPTPPGWNADLNFRPLANLESFRIGGEPITKSEANTLLHKAPKLKRIAWSTPVPFPQSFRQGVEGVISRFMTHNVSSTTSNATEQSASCSEDQYPPPLITATLHPTDVTKVLNTAPSPEVRAAWLEGRAPSASACRLLLKESNIGQAVEEAAEQEADDSVDSHSPVWKKTYEEGREWWRGELD